MAKPGTKIVATPSRVAEYLRDIAVYGKKTGLMYPHALHTWFGNDKIADAAFDVAFDDLTSTSSVTMRGRGTLYDFISETDDDVKRMYFLNLAEYHLAKYMTL